MSNSSLNIEWQSSVEKARSLVQAAQIAYDPTTFYYTPVTLFPRSITPLSSEKPSINLENTPTMFYIHTPVCVSRCTFCPFYFENGNSVSESYTNSVIGHLRMLKSTGVFPSVYSVYFGGGSPNLLSSSQIESVLDEFNWGTIEEVAMELHPKAARNRSLIETLPQLGISRVSLGLQSTQSEILNASSRGHTVQELESLFEQTQALGLRTNIDVLFGGLYGETLSDAQDTLAFAFGELKPEGVSAYQLCIADGTPEEERFQHNPGKYPASQEIVSASS